MADVASFVLARHAIHAAPGPLGGVEETNHLFGPWRYRRSYLVPVFRVAGEFGTRAPNRRRLICTSDRRREHRSGRV
jgi:hypothetical protein